MKMASFESYGDLLHDQNPKADVTWHKDDGSGQGGNLSVGGVCALNEKRHKSTATS